MSNYFQLDVGCVYDVCMYVIKFLSWQYFENEQILTKLGTIDAAFPNLELIRFRLRSASEFSNDLNNKILTIRMKIMIHYILRIDERIWIKLILKNWMVFLVADYESVVKSAKFRMTNLKCWHEILSIITFWLKSVSEAFLSRWYWKCFIK